MSQRTLLFEIGMEECPARFIGPALDELKRLIGAEFAARRIDCGEIRGYATPRRLAAVVDAVAERQRDLEDEVKGPPARIAFAEDGSPTKAAVGFASNQGVDVSDLVVKETEGGDYIFARKREAGRPTVEVLPETLAAVASALRFPKSMRWNQSGLRFARPIRWIVALLGDRLIDIEVGDIRASGVSQGHRFLGEREVALERAEAYEERLLERGCVVVDVDARKALIRSQAEALAASIGGRLDDDDALLTEVANIVEYPTALIGSFDERYLDVPPEILVTSMKEHQRYFPLYRADGSLMPKFIAVRNGSHDHIDVVRAGNERVLSARLSDAKFFYDEDLKRPLAARVPELKGIVFQERLGTIWDKQARARNVLARVAGAYEAEVREKADRAIELGKADLVSHVVYEFPELQGLMGKEYALRSGEDPQVAEAIFEHYLPRFADDALPLTQAGTLAALCDKIDTIVGCFGIGLVPTGSADPYALRRQALGIIRIAIARPQSFTLGDLVDAALEAYGDVIEQPGKVRESVLDFFKGRLQTLLVGEGIRHDLVDAALFAGVSDLNQAWGLAHALSEVSGTETFAALVTAYARAANLAAKAGGNAVDPSLFERDEEARLWAAIQGVRGKVDRLVGEGGFQEAIDELAALRGPVDGFFDAVLVMADDPVVRANRLAILRDTVACFSPVGDLKRVVVA